MASVFDRIPIYLIRILYSIICSLEHEAKPGCILGYKQTEKVHVLEMNHHLLGILNRLSTFQETSQLVPQHA